MRVSRGGRPIQEATAPALPPGHLEKLTHDLWESAIDMQVARAEAIATWQRIRALDQRLRNRPDHPKADQILARAEALSFTVREQMWRFLVLEEDANLQWRQLTVEQRRAEALPDLYHIDAEEPELLGLWLRPIGQQKAPGVPLDPQLYRFIGPEHAKAYQGRSSWRNPDSEYDPESIARSRRSSTASGSPRRSRAAATRS